MTTALALLRRIACSTMQVLPGRARSRRTHMGPFVFVPKDFIYNEPDPSMLPLEFDETTGWTQQSRRVGMLARKIGMTTEFNEWMEMLPITVLHVPKCEVTQVKDEATHGFTAIQVGSGDRKAKNLTKPVLKHLEKAGVGPKAKIAEFRVTPDAIIPVGTCISVRHFLPGQLLDIQGTSKGKGFQGGMKRWGFKGLSATHGVSVSHRSIGSTGQNQTPGKVWKGKKMPGRMGGETVTKKNLYLWKIDVEHELLYIKGAVPGPAGGWLRVMDAKNKLFVEPPPFPTFVASPDEIDPPKVLFARMQRNQAKIGAFSEEEKELIRSSPNYPYMAPLRDETEKEKAFKSYRPAEFVEGE